MEQENSFITVSALYEAKARALGFRLTGGVNGLSKHITSPRVQKLGLALAGYLDYLHPSRVQFVGRTEMSYLSRLDDEERRTAVARLFQLDLSCIVVGGGMQPPEVLVSSAKKAGVPILLSQTPSSRCIDEVSDYLDGKLAPATTVHGVLMEVFGLGVLIVGNSGIGKSECGLELVLRGHRLVSDDSIVLRRLGTGRLMGSGPDFLQFHMELRGLGIINIRDLFGISSVSLEKEINLAVELVRWSGKQEQDRLPLEERRYDILDVALPMTSLPVAPGRHVSTLVEVAVRIHMLKKQGYEPAADFFKALDERIRGER